MKRLLMTLLLVCGFASADTTSNLITNQWTGVVPGSAGGTSGGPAPAYNSGTDTIIFSYGQFTTSQAIAINNALQGTGVKVGGYNYSWDIHNNDQNTGTLVGNVSLHDAARNVIHNYTYDYSNIRTTGLSENFQRFSGTQNFTDAYTAASLSTLTVSWTGRDDKTWAGYYGPRVRNQSVSLNYTVDQCAVNPQSSPACPGYKTYYNISDDGYARVDLPFTFPFYGRNFTTSFFYSNGVVGFLDPNTQGNGFCCEGVNLAGNPGPAWNYAIYALQTDLIASNPEAKFYTQSDSSYMKYTWDKINEYGTSNLNTFSATIRPNGYIGLDYSNINMSRNVTIGTAGDIALGQYSLSYNGPGTGLSALNLLTTGPRFTYSGTEVTDMCLTNPLYSPTCPGYTNAMCTTNPLFTEACPGYAAAYYNLQCSINALYHEGCPGYATAYLDYRCSSDPLYSTQCAGYAQAYHDQQCSLNPLYATDCVGYQTAVTECSNNPLNYAYCPAHRQAVVDCSSNGLTHAYCPSYQVEIAHCSSDPLFNSLCPTYQASTASCNANALNAAFCPGYQISLNSCIADPLSNVLCSGYSVAKQSCDVNQLTYTYCPSYKTTLAACSTDPQSNTMCPGYSTQTRLVSNTTTSTAVSTIAPAPSISSDGTVTTSVSKTGDSVVDKVLAPPPAAAAPAAAVQLTQPPAPAPAPQQAQAPEKKPEGGAQQTAAAPQGGQQQEQSKDQPKSARQEIQERRAEAAKMASVKAGKEASEQMNGAATFEAQKQVQGVIIQAMGFTPGFDVYGKIVVPDASGYKPFTVYNNQSVTDNRRVGGALSGASDRLHNELVTLQYKGEQ